MAKHTLILEFMFCVAEPMSLSSLLCSHRFLVADALRRSRALLSAGVVVFQFSFTTADHLASTASVNGTDVCQSMRSKSRSSSR